MGPPKSRHSRRDIPICASLADELRVRNAQVSTSQLVFYAPVEELSVFCSSLGGRLDQANLRKRVLAPAAAKAGIGHIGLHTMRHTFASMLIAEGRSIVMAQKLMGHHDASLTLRVYAHLVDGDDGGPLDLGLDSTVPGAAADSGEQTGRAAAAGLGDVREDVGDDRGAAVTTAAEPAAMPRQDEIDEVPRPHLTLVESA